MGLSNVITGTFKKAYNMSVENLGKLGYEIVYKGIAENTEKGFTATGKSVNSTIYEIVFEKYEVVKLIE